MTSTSDDNPPIVKVSDEIRSFYAEHGIDLVREFTTSKDGHGVRFVRLNPRFDREETIRQLKDELPPSQRDHFPIPVSWLDPSFGFYALPGDFALSKSSCFQGARVYGQDASSGAAVAALMTDFFDREKVEDEPNGFDGTGCEFRVLDLCCSPGLKLCAIADWLWTKSVVRENESVTSAMSVKESSSAEQDTKGRPFFSVTGVDISETRMSICKSVVRKYQSDQDRLDHSSIRIQLFRNDGTQFGGKDEDLNLVFDSEAARDEARFAAVKGGRKRMNKSARARERKRLRQILQEQVSFSDKGDRENPNRRGTSRGGSVNLFNRVLVDAECSTDGSLKHVRRRLHKQKEAQCSTEIPTLTDKDQLDRLVALQKKLAMSGWNLLEPGGFMVYSTCSLSEAQNEDVVRWLVDKSSAEVVHLEVPNVGSSIREGTLDGTIRFFPSATPAMSSLTEDEGLSLESVGGGFFLAKLRKPISAQK